MFMLVIIALQSTLHSALFFLFLSASRLLSELKKDQVKKLWGKQ